MSDDEDFDGTDRGGGNDRKAQEPEHGGTGDPQQETAAGDDCGPRQGGRQRRYSERERFYRGEGRVFPLLARDLGLKVHDVEHYFRHNGMPPEYIIFGLLMRTFYHDLSSRRFDFIMAEAVDKWHIRRKPSPNTLLWHMRRAELTPVLHQLLGFSALPFLSRDRGFAVDATHIYTDVLLDGGEARGRKKYKWLKLHIICGVSSFVITSARVTRWTDHEMKYLDPMLRDTVALGFDVKSVTADRGYVSKHNIKVIREIGATPYVTFKRNNRKSKSGRDPEWDEALERFRRRQGEDFLPHLKRNMAETTHRMVKKRFGKSVSALDETSQINQGLLKAIGHNLCRMIRLHLNF